MYCDGWFNNITLIKVIKSEQDLVDEETCWKFQVDVFTGWNEGIGERLIFKAKNGQWDLVPGVESKFNHGGGKLVTFSCLLWEKCLGILAV